MIFVDTNVVMYAVGRSHPLREEARSFFEGSLQTRGPRLVTSAEVLQELLHAYLPVERVLTLDSAFTLVESTIPEVWPIEGDDVKLARLLVDRHPGLRARDLLHLACCRRRGVSQIKTFDRGLGAVLP